MSVIAGLLAKYGIVDNGTPEAISGGGKIVMYIGLFFAGFGGALAVIFCERQ